MTLDGREGGGIRLDGEAGWTLSRDGDAALVIAFEARVDPVINARCVAVADALRRRRAAGVRDVVEAFATVTVHFDPLRGAVSELAHQIGQVLRDETPGSGGRASGGGRAATRLPVCYGGEYGPDLAAVARFGACSEAEVIERHRRASYRVYMLGFQPGFAYLGSVDPRIAAPRRATPRVRVPAGSVGIAGRQTGVYPVESPGGWQLIGRTPAAMFDLRRESPFLLQAGDIVRFEPVEAAEYERLKGRGVT